MTPLAPIIARLGPYVLKIAVPLIAKFGGQKLIEKFSARYRLHLHPNLEKEDLRAKPNHETFARFTHHVESRTHAYLDLDQRIRDNLKAWAADRRTPHFHPELTEAFDDMRGCARERLQALLGAQEAHVAVRRQLAEEERHERRQKQRWGTLLYWLIHGLSWAVVGVIGFLIDPTVVLSVLAISIAEQQGVDPMNYIWVAIMAGLFGAPLSIWIGRTLKNRKRFRREHVTAFKDFYGAERAFCGAYKQASCYLTLANYADHVDRDLSDDPEAAVDAELIEAFEQRLETSQSNAADPESAGPERIRTRQVS